MKRYIKALAVSLILAVMPACQKNFDKNEAESLLKKQTLTEEEYDQMISLYESSLSDVFRMVNSDPKSITPAQQDEARLMFELGGRLSHDENKLTDEQNRKVKEITNKVMNEITGQQK